MVSTSKSFIHWNYFLALESDLENISRYIEFTDANLNTYSIELAHLLLASSSECDVVLKELCALLSPKLKGRKNINFYRRVIKSNLPDFIKESIYIPRYCISVEPWDNWGGDNNPYWWTSYNHVKHKRSQYFNEASLRHTISSIGGLLIVCFYYYKKLFEIELGHVIESKKVTDKLQQKSNFVQLNKDFYYDNVVV